MVQRLPAGYVFDPDDPRAPDLDQWERMTPDERARVVDMLPTEVAFKLAEEQRLREDEQRRREEADRRREEAEQQLAEARAEIERLKKSLG